MEEWTGIQGDPIIGINNKGEGGKLSGEELVSMNVWAFPSSVFEFLEKSFVEFLHKLSDGKRRNFIFLLRWINGLSKELPRSR